MNTPVATDVVQVVDFDQVRTEGTLVPRARVKERKGSANSSKWIVLALIAFVILAVVMGVGLALLNQPPGPSPAEAPKTYNMLTGNNAPDINARYDSGTRAVSIDPAAGIGLTSSMSKSFGDDPAFIAWKRTYNKRYFTPLEESTRYGQWLANAQEVEQLQRDNPGATFALGPFADMPVQDFEATHLGPTVLAKDYNLLNSVEIQQMFGSESNFLPSGALVGAAGVPKQFDWRQRKAVAPVKSQQQCSASWSFTASDVVATQRFLKTSILESLSPQQLIDCDANNLGCQGGVLSNAFGYVRNNGLELLNTYPYSSPASIHQSVCRAEPPKAASNTKFITFGMAGETEKSIRTHLVSVGTLAAVMDASGLQFYTGGILSSKNACSSTEVNHAVEIVGYGTDPKYGNYWIVKNSWGALWGENGYFRIASGQNVCAIESSVMYAKAPV